MVIEIKSDIFTDKIVNSNVFTTILFESIDLIASSLGDKFEPFVGLNITSSASPSLKYITSQIDKIGDVGFSNPISVDSKDEFKGELCFEFTAGPLVSFDYKVDAGKLDETSYKFEVFGDFKIKTCPEIKYEPVKADFDFKVVLKPVVFTTGVKYTVTEKGEDPDVKLNTDYTFEITKTDYVIYD